MSSTFWTDLLLRFKSLIGDVAADLLPINFKGVPNSRLAPVLVHAVTIEMGEELGDLSLPWQLSKWGDLGGVKSALGVGRSWAFCCCRSSLIWGTLKKIDVNPLHPNISLQILPIFFHTFPMILTRRTCPTIKKIQSFLNLQSFLWFTWPQCLIQEVILLRRN